MEFFEHSQCDCLCQVTDGLHLPDIVLQALEKLEHLDHVERLVVYTDGSSFSGGSHLSPEQIEEQLTPDAWAFVVLAEQYDEPTSKLALLGWKAHQVRCNPDSPWHIGSRATGAWISEREALTWAFLWRLGLNSTIPTTFRSDSS